MAYYKDDRSFTDYVHSELSIPKIYDCLNWHIQYIGQIELNHIDVHFGIDYVLKNNEDNTINVQERFRDSYYKKYDDATLRYKRDKNSDTSKQKSEFFKIQADCLVYGITNGKKYSDKRHTLTDFIKWVIIDLNFLKKNMLKVN